MNIVLESLIEMRVLPLVRLDNMDDAVPLADALMQGGLKCMAVTVRSKASLTGIAAIINRYPHMIIGAGDVINLDQAKQSIEAGARFVLSPIINKEVIEYCIEENVPVIPGCCTPSEIAFALDCGAELLNFFPAEGMGGVSVLNAISGPFDDSKFLVSNGITNENINKYLGSQKVAVCGVKWIAAPEMVNKKSFPEITKKTKELMDYLLLAT